MSDDARLVVESILRDAGAVALRFHRRAAPSYKGDGSPVTEADHAVERFLIGALSDAFPDDGIVSEEGSTRPSRSGARWVVDPIDGTGAFVSGLAYWGPTVGRIDANGALEVGAFYVPRLAEMWSARRGGGAFRDGERLPRIDPDRPLVPRDVLFAPSRFHEHPTVTWAGKVRCLGSAAAHLALVASGGGVATLLSRWQRWDVGCGALLNLETGHEVRGLDGQVVDPAVCSEGLPLLVGVPKALRALVPEPSSPLDPAAATIRT